MARTETPLGETGSGKVKSNRRSYLITMGSREGDIVLDPFSGTGTTCIAAMMLKRDYLGVEISKEYHEIALKRLEYFRR